VKEILQPDNQRDHLALLLCYLGALGVTEQTATSRWILGIPTLVMHRFYAERILELTLSFYP